MVFWSPEWDPGDTMDPFLGPKRRVMVPSGSTTELAFDSGVITHNQYGMFTCSWCAVCRDVHQRRWYPTGQRARPFGRCGSDEPCVPRHRPAQFPGRRPLTPEPAPSCTNSTGGHTARLAQNKERQNQVQGKH